MSHKEALELIDWLRSDLAEYFSSGSEHSFAQIKSRVEMLSVYSSIFANHKDVLAQIKQIIGGEDLYHGSYNVDEVDEHRDNT